jgi:hypothetical protein
MENNKLNSVDTCMNLKINGSTKFNDSTRLILKYWYTKSKIYFKCHRESAIYYDNINKFMGVPAVITGVFNTTAIFSNYSAANKELMIFNGFTSFVSTVLIGLQNYYDFGRIINIHSKLANGYNKLVHLIEKILIYEKLNLNGADVIDQKVIENIINQMEYLNQDNVNIPDTIWKKHSNELKKMVEILINDKNFFNEIATIDSLKNNVSPENKDSPDDKAIEVIYDNSNK